MNAIKNFKNPLLKRREVILAINSNSNPGFPQVSSFISKEFNADENSISIKAIRGKFGSHEFLIEAFIYDSPQDKSIIEPKAKLKKTKKEGVA